MKGVIIFLLVLLTICKGEAGNYPIRLVEEINTGTNFVCTDEELLLENSHRPNPLLQMIKNKQKRNRKITAAILAFPFPFGIVGLHRIYLGCAPYVPVVYIASVGGGFGILPFIDFCVIVLEKDIDRFSNNNSVFMWVK